MATPPVTPNPVVSPQEFAQKVKTKYPEYASIPDAQLVQKVLTKHPEYGSNIKGFQQNKAGDWRVTAPGTPAPKTTTDKVANWIGKESPTIAGALGGIAGGVAGGIPGAVAGAAAGGAAGETLKEKTMGSGPVSASKVAKEGAE